MGSRSKPRRSGHPAKVAERRERDRARRDRPANALRLTATTFVREAAALEDALDAELWASLLLGTLWSRRDLLADEEEADVAAGGPLIAAIASVGGEGALAALVAIGEGADTQLGPIALTHAEQLRSRGVRPPRWADAITEPEIVGTAVMREDIYDDGMTILIEARHPGDEPHTVGVYIDHNLGGLAKDILMAESIASVSAIVAAENDRHQVRVEPMLPGEACERIHKAIELTDRTLGAPVGEDYQALRAFALLRAADLPGPFPADTGEPEISQAERDTLRDDFLASPEGERFTRDSDEAFVAGLAIDYACDYQVGGPLRWSPVTVELFMADWLPRKVLADCATFEAVPHTLDAWIRYAGHRRGIPDWAIDQTRSSIANWTNEMLDRVDGPRRGGPSMDFLTAAQDAGIDLTDRDAIATFVVDWNARSDGR